MVVLRPSCPEGGSCPSSACGDSCVQCASTSAFCAARAGCVSKEGSCLSSPLSEYEEVRSYSLDSVAGYNVHRLADEEQAEVPLGSRIRVRCQGAVLGKKTLDAEEPQPDTDGGGKKVGRLYLNVCVVRPIDFEIPLDCPQTGQFSVRVKSENAASGRRSSDAGDCECREPIENMTLEADRRLVALGETWTLDVRFQKGTGISLVFDYGNGTWEEEAVRDPAEHQKQLTCHRAGIYNVSVNASNVHGSREESVQLRCHNPVTDFWQLENDSPQPFPPGTVQFCLKFTGTGPMPDNADVSVDFGDGAVEGGQLSEAADGEECAWVIRHDYRAFAREISATLNISNPVEEKSFATAVFLYPADQTFVVTVNDSEQQHVDPYRVDALLYEELLFNVTFGNMTDLDEIYQITFVDPDSETSAENSSESWLKRTFEKKGEYVAYFTVFFYDMSADYSHPVHIHTFENLTRVEITHDGSVPGHGVPKDFNITLENYDDTTCLIFFAEEGIPPQCFGNRTVCLTEYSEQDISPECLPLEPMPLQVSPTYQDLRIVTVKTVAFNPRSRVSHEALVIIKKQDQGPIVWIENNHTSAKNPFTHEICEPLRLETTIILTSNESYTTLKKWTIYVVNGNGMELQTLNPSLFEVNKSSIVVPSLALQHGMYKFVFECVVLDENRTGAVLARERDFTFIRIVKCMLYARILESEQTVIRKGFGQKINLRAKSLSHNPDDPENKQGLEITWFCKRKGETLVRGPKGNLKKVNPSAPITEESQRGGEDKGGCFCAGPGFVELGDGDVDFDTGRVCKSDETYELVAQAQLGNRRSLATLILEVVSGKPPTMIINCEKDHMCFHENDKLYINPNKWLTLKYKCVDGCTDDMSIRWTATCLESVEINAEEEKHIKDLKKYCIGDRGRLGINQTLYAAFPQCKQFRFRITAKSAGGEGKTVIYLIVNRSPEGGTCSVTPTQGISLLDYFYVKCTDWIDPEGKTSVFDYTTEVRRAGEHTMTLRNGIKASFYVVLPQGDLELQVLVEDNWQAETTVVVSVVKVELPTCEEYEEWKGRRCFDKAIGEGDAGLGSQIAVAELMVIRMCSNSSLDDVENMEDLNPDEVNKKWDQYLKMPGKDSSFFTPQAREEVQEMMIEKQEANLDNTAKNNNQMMARLISIRPINSMEDLEMISGAVSCITMNGMMDKEGMDTTLKVLTNAAESLSGLPVSSAEDIRNLLEKICNIMDRIVTSVATQQMLGFCFKGDRDKAEKEKENSPDTQNPFLQFVAPQTKKEAMKNKKQKAAESCADPVYAKEIITTIQHVTDIIKSIILDLIFENKPFELVTESKFRLMISKISRNENKMVITKREAMFNSSDVCELSGKPEGDCGSDTSVAVQMVKWNRPFNCYSNDTDKLYKGSATIQMEIVDADNKSVIPQESYQKRFKFSIPRDEPTPCLKMVKVDFKTANFLAYHPIVVRDLGVSVVFQFKPECRAPFVVFTKYGSKPTVKDFENIFRPVVDEDSGMFTFMLTTDHYNEDNSTLYVAVGHLNNDTDADLFFDDVKAYNLTAANMTNRFFCNYSYCLFSTACYYFDSDNEIWSTEGCEVEAVGEEETNCSCDHLTSFVGGFFVAPNTVDFDYVLKHADFSNNYIIYTTLIITFLVYIIILIWARWKDKKDVEKLGATPLPDNDPKDKYVYEIMVFTGHQLNAGTKSKVYFMVSGEDDETEVRTMADGKRPILRSGNVDVFVMATFRSLGDLFYLRIWHDSSGKGQWASWYLKYIVFRDVQTGQKYEFIANKWFAVEEGDGLIDRLLPVAGKEQKTEFSHLFSTTSRQKLSDSHLWFSVFLRPPRSRFTRVQRVSCCMAVLYLSMLVNAMWYQRTSNQPSPGALKLGPFSLTMEQVMVGIMSNFIVFPPSFFMIFFFRKSRPRKLRPSRIEEALKKQKSEWEAEFGGITANEGSGRKNSNEDLPRKTEKVKKKRKFTLPWWCVIFGWFFVIASIGVSIFFLWAYGIQFGNEKTSKWLTALVISFFSSVLLTQPIKIFLIAMFLSMVCQKLDYDEDDADEDEEDPRLKKDEQWLHVPQPLRTERHVYRPLDPKAIEAARQEREKEMRFNSLMKEICGYGAFLWLVIVMCMAERDPNGYYMRLNLINDFIKPGDLWNDFNNVNTERRFWNWTEESLIPELIAGDWYNDRPPLGLRGFLDDRNNLKISYAIMRQIRIKPDSCVVAKKMRPLTPECASYGSIIFEDGGLYGANWNPNFTAETPPEYKYLTASQLKGYPFWGMMDYYSGGGYVVPLFEKQDDVRYIVKKLQRDNWIGRHTRAVFIEISVYNAQVNLFAAVTIVAEFLPGGGITPYYHIDPIRLLFYHNSAGTFFLVVQILFLFFVLYITIRELRTFYKQRTKYFGEYWNMCHFAILMFSYVGIAIFVYRLILTHRILKIFRDTEGTGYVKLQEAVLYNCMLSYALAFLMFLATLQFLKLLRFNKRMGILAKTLRKVAEELRSFGICLLVVFVAFVFMFWLLLGRAMWEFSTFLLSFESCISMLLKKFKYPEMEAAAPFFVPIVFFIFSISAAMVLVNLLLTIIIQSFEDVKVDIAKEDEDAEMLSFAINRIKLMVGIGRSRVQPLPPIVPTRKTVSTQDTLKAFPSKVDQLLQFVNNVYFDSEIDFNSKDLLKKMRSSQYQEEQKGRSGKRKPDVLKKYGSNKARREFGNL